MSPDGDDLAGIVGEIDAEHRRARSAFRRKDLAAYERLFSPDLRYRQADGRVIGRERLMRSVADQFNRCHSIDSTYTRERIERSGDLLVETLSQTAAVLTTALVFLHRSWKVTRRGSYAWRNVGDGWRIEEVQVLEEQTRRGRIRCGLWIPPPEGLTDEGEATGGLRG
jgi:ketosteroid isomerase-like protein